MDGETVALGRPLLSRFCRPQHFDSRCSCLDCKIQPSFAHTHSRCDRRHSLHSISGRATSRKVARIQCSLLRSCHASLNPSQAGSSLLFRVASYMASFVASQKYDASAFCSWLCLLCCNLLAHLSHEEETFSELSSQSSLLQLLDFTADCMSKPHLCGPVFEAFGSKGFSSLLTFCEESATTHVLSVDVASEAGSSMFELMWSLYSL